jgi:hypothetical protein
MAGAVVGSSAAAGEALPVADGEQVGAELVDLVEQTGLGGCGQAEDGDDGSHADGDTECGQPCPQRSRA